MSTKRFCDACDKDCTQENVDFNVEFARPPKPNEPEFNNHASKEVKVELCRECYNEVVASITQSLNAISKRGAINVQGNLGRPDGSRSGSAQGS